MRDLLQSHTIGSVDENRTVEKVVGAEWNIFGER